jgi:tetratricopeptide (TPR) repeat protein
VQVRAGAIFVRAVARRLEERYDEALAAGEEALALFRSFHNSANATECFVEAVEAAFGLGALGRFDELLGASEQLPPVERSQYLEAQVARFRALLAARRQEGAASEQQAKRAVGQFRELGMPFWLAVTLLEYGEWLVGQDRREEAEPLLTEARKIFERLKARPWLERLERVALAEAAAV